MITRRLNDLCLPSAEDTDVTELYRLTKSHDPMAKHSPLVSHDPVGTSHNSEISSTQASCDPIKLPSHDSLVLASHDPLSLASCDQVAPASHDPVKPALHDPVASYDMDTLMASLSVFDATHLGRLGTAVSMETSSMIIM